MQRILLLPKALLLIPLGTFSKSYAAPTKDIQSTPYRQVHPSRAQVSDKIKILNVSRPAGIGHWFCTPLPELDDKVLVDTVLQALVVRGVDQELRAVGLE